MPQIKQSIVAENAGLQLTELPRTIKQAKEAGSDLYFSGRPCKKGHISGRYVSSRNCSQCAKDKASKWRSENPEKANSVATDWRRKNPERAKEYSRLQGVKYRSENPDKCYEAVKKYIAKNRHYYNEYQRKREANKSKATPAWYESEDVKALYKEASGKGFHVDHIVPLKSDKVCGLHCIDNLQILSPSENIKKGNRYWPNMP